MEDGVLMPAVAEQQAVRRTKPGPLETRKSGELKGPRGHKQLGIWEDVFHKYAVEHRSLRDLAKEYGFSQEYLARAIKWVSRTYNNSVDVEVHEAVFKESTRRRLEQMLQELNDIAAPDLRIQLLAEIRRTEQMLAKAQGVFGEGDGGGKRPPINIILPNFNAGPKVVE